MPKPIHLAVNEIYGPVNQGEGKSTGMECAFLRLAACNLSCIWCDTPYTWNWTGTHFAHPDKYDKSKEVHRKSTVDCILEICHAMRNSNRALVISGGEPFLQQKNLLPLINGLRELDWWIEIETNGTILPLPEMYEGLHQINCSPKLRNSGDPEFKRIRPLALWSLAHHSKTNFKFVVGNIADMDEILRLVDDYRMKEVYLMPMGRTREELYRTTPIVDEMCKLYGFHNSQRLHVLQHGDKRKV